MTELRWYTRTTKREDYTDAEWLRWCTAHMDPEPPLNSVRILQFRSNGGIWRDVPEVKDEEFRCELSLQS